MDERRRNSPAVVSLPSDHEILVTRAFRAPRELVFEMWSNPQHVRRWYACEAFGMPTCEIDLTVGGTFRWVMRDPSGTDHAMSGVYLEIRRPERLVYSEVYEPVPGSDHVVTLTFEEDGGLTTVRQRIAHTSRANRDGHLQSGMETGLEAAFQRIDDALATKAAPAPAVEAR